MTLAADPVGADVFQRLAVKIRELARSEHLNNGSGAERCSVTALSPLMLEAFESDLVLTEGDEDFTVGSVVRAHLTAATLTVGDEVWVLREGQRWQTADVATADA